MAIELSSQLYIKLNGNMTDEFVMGNLLFVLVDQHSHLPDTFSMQLSDNSFYFIDEGHFNLTDTIEIGAFADGGQPISLFKGEITALEPDFTAEQAVYLTIRGYDKSHRLYREKKTRSFLNVKDSDLAEQLATQAGLTAVVEPTTIVYEHILQHNQSDLDLLQQRAWRIGYECFVADDTLYFQRPQARDDQVVTLQWGENNLSMRPRMVLSEQVSEVVTRGWDPAKLEPIVGMADTGALTPAIGEPVAASEWIQPFGSSKMVLVDQAITSQSEANLLAQARFDELSGVFVELDGSVFRRPDLQAGRYIDLSGFGNRFSGQYFVTTATHVYSATMGLETKFEVRGLRNGLLLEQIGNRPNPNVWSGVAIAIVTNNNDPENHKRIKVKYPWLADDVESHWARIVTSSGSVNIPAVGDEVLVGFEQGDPNRPYIYGNLPPITASSGGSQASQTGNPADQKLFASPSGHALLLDDGAANSVTLTSSAGSAITLDDRQQLVTLTTPSGLTIQLNESNREISITSPGNVNVNSAGNLALAAGGNIDINATGQVNVRGTRINLN